MSEAQLQLLIAARFFVGVGLGGVPASFALFMEFLPTANRAKYLVILQVPPPPPPPPPARWQNLGLLILD